MTLKVFGFWGGPALARMYVVITVLLIAVMNWMDPTAPASHIKFPQVPAIELSFEVSRWWTILVAFAWIPYERRIAQFKNLRFGEADLTLFLLASGLGRLLIAGGSSPEQVVAIFGFMAGLVTASLVFVQRNSFLTDAGVVHLVSAAVASVSAMNILYGVPLFFIGGVFILIDQWTHRFEEAPLIDRLPW